MTGNNTLGKAIRLMRRQNGWSQGEVAEKIGMSTPAYSKIETGVTDLNLSRLREIASAFGLTDVELLSLPYRIAAGKNSKLDASCQRLMLEEARKRLMDRDRQVMDLQKKVIQLFEQLKK